MRQRLIHAANLLTLSRFAAAPVMLGLLLRLRTPAEEGMVPWFSAAAFALLVATLLTDLFDGMVARAQHQVSDFGKIMDPVADSTFFMTLLFGLAACPRFNFPIWIPLIVLWREVAMHVLRRYAALRGRVLAAKTSGKAKMVVQSVLMLAFFLALGASDLGAYFVSEATLDRALWVGGVVIAVVNLLSLVEYMREAPALFFPPDPRDAASRGDGHTPSG